MCIRHSIFLLLLLCFSKSQAQYFISVDDTLPVFSEYSYDNTITVEAPYKNVVLRVELIIKEDYLFYVKAFDTLGVILSEGYMNFKSKKAVHKPEHHTIVYLKKVGLWYYPNEGESCSRSEEYDKKGNVIRVITALKANDPPEDLQQPVKTEPLPPPDFHED